MDFQREIRNLFYHSYKPIQKEKNYIQIIHYYGEQRYPYLNNEITELGVYQIPDYLSYEEFFKVISYYSEKIDMISTYPCSLDGAKYLEQLLVYLGCVEKTDTYNYPVFPVYIACGCINDGYPKYYEWYSRNVSLEDIKKIYLRHGIQFNDFFDTFLENYTPVEKGRVLVRSSLEPPYKRYFSKD